MAQFSKTLFLILTVMLPLLANAQDVIFNKANFKNDPDGLKTALKELSDGDRFYIKSIHSQALEHYLKANSFNENNSELNAKIGHCYLRSATKEKAITYLEKAQKLNPNIDGYFIVLLGKAYHVNNRFDDAIKIFRTAQSKTSKVNPQEMENIKKYIEECSYAKKLVAAPVNVKIRNLGNKINTEAEEYVPVITADESTIIFTSRRSSTLGGNLDNNLGDYYEDIFVAEKVDGKWTEAANIGAPINSERHDATVGLSIDGQKLLIYRDDEKGIGNILISEKKGNTWSEPEKLPSPINSKYQETSACFSYDENSIYFVSDRPGGIGGKDIFVSKKQKDGSWGEPENLGNIINTPYDEDGVFLHPDGKTLYFSSKGHKTMGGYDIFKSVNNKGKWSKPENLGYPINTSDDDVCFVLAASGENGYFTSIRPEGKGKRDIYKVTFLDEIENKKNQPKLTLLKGAVLDGKTNLPVGSKIEIFDNTKNEVVANYESNSVTGNYILSLPAGRNYGISVKADGYLFHSEHFDIPDTAAFMEIIKIVYLQKLEVGAKVVLKNIFYDYGKATLRSESYNELAKVIELLQQNPKLKIEISSHTDSRGGEAFNNKLSEDRAKSCVDYLLQKGVNTDKLIAKGYGKQQLLITDDQILKLLTEEEKENAHQQNRRTEFKILSN
jgi:outer membrane protein OmpA-like peptidoglycan-associated protein/tetratricopeptide (TPR) repeat protein